ncbi:MAG: hypothetical protein AUI11_12340 [Acidobacteria bacterium 13_2_20CM_2_66_4]|nr:MAG: hypothetical protein AUI11_12340 [Acidobacteria bacterium 13_2_20CM_2_66_4]
MAFHAAAHVEQQRNADAGGVAAEICNRPLLTAVEDLEIVSVEVLNESTLVVAHHRGDSHQIDARLERGGRWLLPRVDAFAANGESQ